jgi:hypothetical protein
MAGVLGWAPGAGHWGVGRGSRCEVRVLGWKAWAGTGPWDQGLLGWIERVCVWSCAVGVLGQLQVLLPQTEGVWRLRQGDVLNML